MFYVRGDFYVKIVRIGFRDFQVIIFLVVERGFSGIIVESSGRLVMFW